jgi:hypothetical protein
MSFYFCQTTLLASPRGHKKMTIAYAHYNVVSVAKIAPFITGRVVWQ